MPSGIILTRNQNSNRVMKDNTDHYISAENKPCMTALDCFVYLTIWVYHGEPLQGVGGNRCVVLSCGVGVLFQQNIDFSVTTVHNNSRVKICSRLNYK